MSLPTNKNTQSISFADLKDEFGSQTGNHQSLGRFRGEEGPGTPGGSGGWSYGEWKNKPVDDGVPRGDQQIALSDFYGKKLNMVVDYYTGIGFYGGNEENNARSKYNNYSSQNLTVNPVSPGLLNSLPSGGGGKKIIIHVNKVIGGFKDAAITACALRTGSWESGTEVTVDIGTNGMIVGAGGDGGKGGDHNGEDGKHGTSALGIDQEGTKINIQGDSLEGGVQQWSTLYNGINVTSGNYHCVYVSYGWVLQGEFYSYVESTNTYITGIFTYTNSNGDRVVVWYDGGYIQAATAFGPGPYDYETKYIIQDSNGDYWRLSWGEEVPGPWQYENPSSFHHKLKKEKWDVDEDHGTFIYLYQNLNYGSTVGIDIDSITTGFNRLTRKNFYSNETNSSGTPLYRLYRIKVEELRGSSFGGGAIVGGFGGGGGGGGAESWDINGEDKAGGSGGGGGAGYPWGWGGDVHGYSGVKGIGGGIPNVRGENTRADDNAITGGNGGGETEEGEAWGGYGGFGGDTSDRSYDSPNGQYRGGSGEDGRGEGHQERDSEGGSPGGNGSAIRVSDNDITWSHTSDSNQDRVWGSTGDIGVT